MRARALLVSFALATALAAQQRVPLLGTVVDAKKVPIAGAIVQLAHVPPGCEGEVAADHPTATTDERRIICDLVRHGEEARAQAGPCTSVSIESTERPSI